MAASARALARTLLSLTPPVIVSMALAVGGLFAARTIAPSFLRHTSNDVVGSYLQTVGTVYAVLLAFVVFVVWTQFNDTRRYVEQEANQILDLSRTAKGFATPVAVEVHRHALRYVEAVLGPEWTAMEHDVDVAVAGDIVEDLWAALHDIDLKSDCERAIYGEVIGHFNDLSDARSERLANARIRIPLALWVLLRFGQVIIVGSMYLFVVDKPLVHAVMTALLAGALSHILYVVGDLDTCFSGAWQVPRKPFEDVRRYLQKCLTTQDVSP